MSDGDDLFESVFFEDLSDTAAAAEIEATEEAMGEALRGQIRTRAERTHG